MTPRWSALLKKSLNPVTVSAALLLKSQTPPPRLEHLCSTANIKINRVFLWVLPSGASAYIYISRRDWSRRDVGALMLAVFRILKCHHSKTPQPTSSHSQRIKFPRATCGVLRHPSSSHRTHPFVEGRKAAMLFSPRCLRLIQHRTWSTPEPRTPPEIPSGFR